MSNATQHTTSTAAARVPWRTLAAEPLELMNELEAWLKHCGLERSLIELVKTRVSQINGCAYCVDMHTKDARHMGESEQRLYALSTWREAPFFSARERAALMWAESVTHIAVDHVPDRVYEKARRHFGEEEIVHLTWVIAAINSWNRLAVTFRQPVGKYQPTDETD